MSAGIMPDIYRHTARKSTVSKPGKSSTIALCNNNNSTTSYATYHSTNNSNGTILFDTLECNIKLEKDVPQVDEPFLLLPDNEMEEMSIGEEIEQTTEEIIQDIMEQIVQSSSNTFHSTSDQINRSLSINTQDVHHVIDSMINQFNELDEKEFLSDHIEENVNTSSDEMESDQPTSTTSRSQTEDDTIEIEGTSSHDSPHQCTCQCHKPSSPLNNDYLLFEQALKQARLEQQQEKFLTKNPLIQTLKRQHEELMSIYQQNQKHVNKTKIDREQQTTKLHLHDSQIQTDITVVNSGKTSPQQKSMIIPTINSHTNGPLTATRNHLISSNSNQKTAVSSSPQTAPRLAASAIATTSTSTNKTTMVTNSLAAAAAALPQPPPLLTTASSHDIVDLTEEDEDDGTTRATTTPLRQSTSSISPTTSTSTTATEAATRSRSTNRTIRPNNPPTNGQAFPLRSLPEHVPCDQTIARPQLSITQENATVRLTWNLQSTPMESIQNYEIYAYKQNATATAGSDWKKIGSVKSMRLPMAVTLKEFQSNSHYAFAVRAVSIHNHIGPFCEPKTIFTGITPVQPLHTSQLLNVSS